jgi:hypothetical protein
MGSALILIALFMPRGISGLIADVRKWRARSSVGTQAALATAADLSKS